MAMITPGSINMLHDAHPSQQGGNKVKGAKIELISNQDMRLTRGADQKWCAPKWLDKETSYIAFQEGWAMYAENPILSDDVNLYKETFSNFLNVSRGSNFA